MTAGATMIHPNQPGPGSHVANATGIVKIGDRHHHVDGPSSSARWPTRRAGLPGDAVDLVVETNTDSLALNT